MLPSKLHRLPASWYSTSFSLHETIPSVDILFSSSYDQAIHTLYLQFEQRHNYRVIIRCIEAQEATRKSKLSPRIVFDNLRDAQSIPPTINLITQILVNTNAYVHWSRSVKSSSNDEVTRPTSCQRAAVYAYRRISVTDLRLCNGPTAHQRKPAYCKEGTPYSFDEVQSEN